jgi:hypothetical protein
MRTSAADDGAIDRPCTGRSAADLTEVERHAPLPVHIVTPQGRLSVPKVRAFVDFIVPCLRAQFARLRQNFLSTDRDWATLRGGLRLLREVATRAKAALGIIFCSAVFTTLWIVWH